MKIALEIPDWAEKANLYLITRNEMVAAKEPGGSWRIKARRCNQCDRCCELHPRAGAYFKTTPSGACVNLSKDGRKKVCSIGMEKPLACVLGEPEGVEYKKFRCCIEYK